MKILNTYKHAINSKFYNSLKGKFEMNKQYIVVRDAGDHKGLEFLAYYKIPVEDKNKSMVNVYDFEDKYVGEFPISTFESLERNDDYRVLLQKIVNVGKDKIRFYTEMEGYSPIPFIGWGMSNGKFKITECVLDESRYRFGDDYKVGIKSIDENHVSSHNYYVSDFMSMINSGHIVVSDKQLKVQNMKDIKTVGGLEIVTEYEMLNEAI